MTREIEDAIEEYARNGVEIRKISIVGYSLGGSSEGQTHCSIDKFRLDQGEIV